MKKKYFFGIFKARPTTSNYDHQLKNIRNVNIPLFIVNKFHLKIIKKKKLIKNLQGF